MIAKPKSKKERIIAAAIRLWQKTHNVNKVSLADIAQEASVSPTTIYNNFGTRERLVEEVIKHVIKETLDKQWAVIRSELPIPLKMQGILSVKMAAMQDMQVDLLTKLNTDPAISKYIDEIYQTEMKPMMTTVIEEGKRQGYIHPDLPDEVVMIYLDILKAGGIACAGELQRITGDRRLLTGLTRIFYYGLFQKEFDFAIDFNKKKETA